MSTGFLCYFVQQNKCARVTILNGAESLVRSLIENDLELCFANPGTSEMHFVAALDKVPGLRCVLGLHETVVTGAADGYARMAEKPAATLLHTGPGLANGLSNLHNARKAWTPVVNIVGEHALSHIEHDAPLNSDIEGIARPMSHWVHTPKEAASLAQGGAEAVAQARRHPGHIATLILPANTAWDEVVDDEVIKAKTEDETEAETNAQSNAQTKDETEDEVISEDTPASVNGPSSPFSGVIVEQSRIDSVAGVLESAQANDEAICIILGGHCLQAKALELADQIAQQCLATLMVETFKSRWQRGAGRVSVKEIPYPVDAAVEVLAPFTHVLTVCAKAPVGFFAYPDKPSKLYPEHAQVHELAAMHDDGLQALQDLVVALGASGLQPRLQTRRQHEEPEEQLLTPDAIGVVLANRSPENAIIVDEAVTSGVGPTKRMECAAAHDWLEVCGGSIGGGMPLATGAAVACPDRKVINLQADGSGMYSLQSLWTQAREQLNVVTIVFANGSYAILKHELDNVQATSGRVALDMMELDRPALDWVAMSTGMGVSAKRATCVDEFRQALDEALTHNGPFLIEAVIP